MTFMQLVVGTMHQSRQSARGFVSSRPNWNPPSPYPQASVPPPLFGSNEGTHSLTGECVGGVPIRTRGKTLWYSRYICTVLCGTMSSLWWEGGGEGGGECVHYNCTPYSGSIKILRNWKFLFCITSYTLSFFPQRAGCNFFFFKLENVYGCPLPRLPHKYAPQNYSQPQPFYYCTE